MRLIAFAACLFLSPAAWAQSVTMPAAADEVLAVWQVDISSVSSNTQRSSQTRSVRYGPDWASWVTEQGAQMWLDINERALYAQARGQNDIVRTSLFAEARRHLDIYVALSEGGRRDVISFGNAGTFDRVWLEAATGVASQGGALSLTETEAGFIALYDDQLVFRADYGEADTQCDAPSIGPQQAASAMAWLPYVAPIHPEILARLSEEDRFPCAFSFVVYSPDSPAGRLERWTRVEADDAAMPELPPLPDDAAVIPAGADRLSQVMDAAQSALANAQDAAPDLQDFFDESQSLQEDGDYAGALLVQIHETHHFGPCPEASIGSDRLTCAYASALALQGREHEAFRALSRGLDALAQDNPAEAVDLIAPFIERDGHPGAAARLLTAKALIAWGRVGLQARPDLDPAQLLAEALIMDPYAPDAYWGLGQRYLAAGAPGPAWSLFDLGRQLPRPIDQTPLAQADLLEARMSELAPFWLPADPTTPVQ
ncbi:hypothetical protein [Oceanicaulis sp. MMSF_3324]|uniref:hypothetical protein n=1 Tax=Oceanicaulis sp. MMSF_3324 TaxID=3046702 RepID=UPI00273F23CE|nr:hypothetical protein [Oceanicaulis sp. MMSF_3324]